MSNSEKVVKGLECCLKYETLTASGLVCEECPYNKNNYLGTCTALLFRDTIELLKEQDKTIESLTKENERLLLERIAELQHNIDALHATMQDAILVNNAIEQRKAVKLDD